MINQRFNELINFPTPRADVRSTNNTLFKRIYIFRRHIRLRGIYFSDLLWWCWSKEIEWNKCSVWEIFHNTYVENSAVVHFSHLILYFFFVSFIIYYLFLFLFISSLIFINNIGLSSRITWYLVAHVWAGAIFAPLTVGDSPSDRPVTSVASSLRYIRI